MNLQPKELRGSRLRCLMLTSLARKHVARFLTKMAAPIAQTYPENFWMPHGFIEPVEARLEKEQEFILPEQREELARWWLKSRNHHANTPNWDLICTSSI